jgi:hypothetical protein
LARIYWRSRWRRSQVVGRTAWGFFADQLDRQHTEEDPNERRDDRHASKNVAGFGTEGTLSAHAAKGTGQAAPFALLDQNQGDQEQRRKNQQRADQEL